MTLGEVTRASRPELQADEAPVGVGEVADDFPHGRWLFLDQTEIHRDWNARYVWPKFVTAVPADFFEAVRSDAAGTGAWITPQSRDMNPIYTGKDVSYIDTKQAQRAAEVACLDGERLATLAWLAGALYPAESIDKAWRQIAYGAHHDAITGTEGDQVYLDLLPGWREAWERGDVARAASSPAAGQVGPPGERYLHAGDRPNEVLKRKRPTRERLLPTLF